jgi:DNA-binding NarL/FixJ family response regulator
VDDDEVDRENFKRLMTGTQTQDAITEATSMTEARTILSAREFDCLVLDYLLPEGPCVEFLGELRELAPGAAIIVLTGRGDERVRGRMPLRERSRRHPAEHRAWRGDLDRPTGRRSGPALRSRND